MEHAKDSSHAFNLLVFVLIEIGDHQLMLDERHSRYIWANLDQIEKLVRTSLILYSNPIFLSCDLFSLHRESLSLDDICDCIKRNVVILEEN